MILDAISLAAGVAYVGTLIPATIFARPSATLRQLTTAVRIFWFAFVAAIVALAANLADVPNDGWFWPLLWAFNAGACLYCLVMAHKRRTRKGEQVTADAERMVREWTGGAS